MFLSKQKDITLYSNLSLEECTKRLLKNIDTSNSFNRLFLGRITGKPVGKLSNSTLNIRKYIPYSNSAQTILTAKLISDKETTIITCSFDMRKSVKFFLIFWFSFVILFNLAIVIQFISLMLRHSHQLQNWSRLISLDALPLLIPFGMLFVGYSIVFSGINSAKGEDLYLLEFIKNTLNASEQNASS